MNKGIARPKKRSRNSWLIVSSITAFAVSLFGVAPAANAAEDTPGLQRDFIPDGFEISVSNGGTIMPVGAESVVVADPTWMWHVTGSLFTRATQISRANKCMFLAVIPAPFALNFSGSGCK